MSPCEYFLSGLRWKLRSFIAVRCVGKNGCRSSTAGVECCRDKNLTYVVFRQNDNSHREALACQIVVQTYLQQGDAKICLQCSVIGETGVVVFVVGKIERIFVHHSFFFFLPIWMGLIEKETKIL